MNGFDSALAIGVAGENKVRDVFLAAGAQVKSAMSGNARIGQRKDLVVMLRGEHERIEVKNEAAFRDSNNVCVEMQQGFGKKKKPSGIEVSESTVGVHLFGDDYCIAYRTVDLRNHIHMYIEDGWYKLTLFHRADNNNFGVLVPKSHILQQGWGFGCALQNLPNCRVFSFNEVAA